MIKDASKKNQISGVRLHAFILSLIGVLFIMGPSYSKSILETKDYILYLEAYLRSDLVSFKNVVDLDSRNSDDTTTYMGLDYSLGFKAEFKDSGSKLYLKLERNGPYDYDAPIFVHNTLMTSAGVIEKYRNDEFLPGLEEFWLDLSLPNDFRFKFGLYAYLVGNGFSLNGGYENYGFTISRELDEFTWRLYYCRPDLVYKNHLGPRIRQEEEQGIVFEPNAANFFAADIQFAIGKNSFQPYIGVLADYTSPEKRDNIFTAPIEKDILGTLGIAWSLKQDDLLFKAEFAHNFGRAKSADTTYKDVYHTGYVLYTGLDYNIGKITPSFQFLLCSGNKETLDMAANQDTTLTSAKNRAFSYYSPLNMNLADSISSSNTDMLPIVAMGGGYGLNYGVPRPRTFAVGDFDNLIMPCLGLDFNVTDKLSINFYYYYLRSFEKPAGSLDGVARYLSRELGNEIDLFIDYKLNQHTLFSILGGYFFPGKYYKEKRDDIEGNILSPFVRGDEEIDKAFQIELAVEVKF